MTHFLCLVNAISKTIETLCFFFPFEFLLLGQWQASQEGCTIKLQSVFTTCPQKKNLSIVWLPIAGRDRNMANLTQDCSFCDDFSFQKTEIL
jgi:hypothetical protein